MCGVVGEIAEVFPFPGIRHPVAVGIHEFVSPHVDIGNTIGVKQDPRFAIDIRSHTVGLTRVDARGISSQPETGRHEHGIRTDIPFARPSILHTTVSYRRRDRRVHHDGPTRVLPQDGVRHVCACRVVRTKARAHVVQERAVLEKRG